MSSQSDFVIARGFCHALDRIDRLNGKFVSGVVEDMLFQARMLLSGTSGFRAFDLLFLRDSSTLVEVDGLS